MEKVRFIVPGEPTGKGRPRFRNTGRFQQAYTPEKTASYENLIKLQYQAQCGNWCYGKEDALGMLITAYKRIPGSTSKKKLRMMLDGTIYPAKSRISTTSARYVAMRSMALPSTTMRRLWMAE